MKGPNREKIYAGINARTGNAAKASPQKLSNVSIIGTVLTEEQKRHVEKALVDLKLPEAEISLDEFKRQICWTLLDPKSFSLAGNDFFKKLNTIQKIIRKGQWHFSLSALQHEQKQKNQALAPLERELREACAEHRHWQELKTMSQEKGQTHLLAQFEQFAVKSSLRVAEIKNTITALRERLQAEDRTLLPKVSGGVEEANSSIPAALLQKSAAVLKNPPASNSSHEERRS
jgi:hypothetical protein